MARNPRIAIVLAALPAAALLAAPPAPAQESYGSVTEEHIVETRHGDIYVEVVRPVDGDKMVKGPVVLTYTPYAALGRNGDAPSYVRAGYVRATADVVGTGNSGGCYDYGGKREKETGYDLVEWLAKQKWSTGKVAMTGGSYNGTTAIATAVMDPPHLVTIVPEAAISRWYSYAYSGGIRYFLNNERPHDEGFDTPLVFDFGFALPPPIDVYNDRWAERVRSTITPCEEIEHTERGYDDTPDYDKFWLERDYIKDADNVDIPVLIAHNWGDWNVKQEEAINLYRALDESPNVKLFLGSRYLGHSRSGEAWARFDQVKRQWFDHYLMGADNGAPEIPDVTSQMADYEGTTDFYSGRWPKTRPVELIAQEVPRTEPNDYQWKLLPQRVALAGPVEPSVARFPSAGINTESHANHHARNNHDWYYFESPQLSRDVRIFGEPKVEIWSTVDRRWVTFTPTLLDIDPGSHTTVANQHIATDRRALRSVTRGWLDSRYRKTLSKQIPIEPGKPFGMTVVMKPQDYTFKKGHHIGLNIQTEINEWSLPKPYPCTSADCLFVRINWERGKTRLTLPVVGAPKDPMMLFSRRHDH